MTPVFSVIIPTHDRVALVVRAIDSALSSEAAGLLDVIVVDDASTDGTTALLEARYGNDARVRILRSASNEGPTVARNRGMAMANGIYLIFLDSDDVLLPYALAAALAVFQRFPDLQFLSLEGEVLAIDRYAIQRRVVREGSPGWHAPGFGLEKFRTGPITLPRGISDEVRTLTVGDFLPAILFGDLFYLSGLVIRRDAARIAGPFNRRFRYLEDWDFHVRLCLAGIGGYLDYVGFYRETGRADQLSRVGTDERRAIMHKHVLATFRTASTLYLIGKPPKALQRAQASAEYWLGRCLVKRHHPRRARAYFLRALRTGHKPLKCLFWLLQSLGVPARAAP